jgi:hypothetical protein
MKNIIKITGKILLGLIMFIGLAGALLLIFISCFYKEYIFIILIKFFNYCNSLFDLLYSSLYSSPLQNL